METSQMTDAQERKRSGYAGMAAVAVTLGLTELFAGMFASVPSAVASIGAIIVDISPSWLESFAIDVFGTYDKLVLGIGTFVVAILIGGVLGRRSLRNPAFVIAGFIGFGIAGVLAQLDEPGAETGAVIAAMLVAVGVGLAAFFGFRSFFEPEEAHFTDDDVGAIVKRRLIVGIAAAVTVTAVSVGVGRAMLRSRSEAQRAALVLPNPVEAMADPTEAHDFGLKGVAPVVVGNSTFYRIDTALVVPAVDTDMWSLRIHGMVDQEVKLSYKDLRDLDQIERYATLSCVSNEVGGRLVGNALWTGVLLKDILDMAGVQSGAEQVVGRSVDGWTAGFPVEYAFDEREAMVAIGMNREILPTSHGFPARLVVPGLYGYVSATKWLSEIELTEWDAFDGYWIPRGWSKEGPIKTQSRIDRPKHNSSIDVGSYTLGGVAWAPTLGVEMVEVQIDDGPWVAADLAESLSDNSWRLWKLDIEVSEGRHTARVRATDGTGYTQTEERTNPRPDGATGYHIVDFTAKPVA
jgi:DMSO/TMAO reductase YedYZ molybdopterin-dependent catalytic subunit